MLRGLSACLTGHSKRVSKDRARSETSLSGSSVRVRNLVSKPKDLSRTMASLQMSREGSRGGEEALLPLVAVIPAAVLLGVGPLPPKEPALAKLSDDEAGRVGCVRLDAIQTPATRISTLG